MSAFSEHDFERMQPQSQSPDRQWELFEEFTGRTLVVVSLLIVLLIAVGVI